VPKPQKVFLRPQYLISRIWLTLVHMARAYGSHLCIWLVIISRNGSNGSDTNCGILPELHMGRLPGGPS
jgi:hypothetical protein